MHLLMLVVILQLMSGKHNYVTMNASATTLDLWYRVDILDFNERAPEFSQSIYYGFVDENLSVGAYVVVVNCC